MVNVKKFSFRGAEGEIKGFVFWLFKKKWIVALSETKWHAGDKFKYMPIWGTSISGVIPAIFIWKLAVGFESKREIRKDV